MKLESLARNQGVISGWLWVWTFFWGYRRAIRWLKHWKVIIGYKRQKQKNKQNKTMCVSCTLVVTVGMHIGHNWEIWRRQNQQDLVIEKKKEKEWQGWLLGSPFPVVMSKGRGRDLLVNVRSKRWGCRRRWEIQLETRIVGSTWGSSKGQHLMGFWVSLGERSGLMQNWKATFWSHERRWADPKRAVEK